LSFTPENPTGNYFLDLANPADFAVAEQVLVLNQWEILQLVKGKTEKQQTKRINKKKRSKDVVFKGLFVVCFEVFYFLIHGCVFHSFQPSTTQILEGELDVHLDDEHGHDS